MSSFYGTTILCVRKNNCVVMGGDGQVTFGNVVLKNNVKKIRFLFNKSVIAGFAGSTADAFTLFEKFEEKLELYYGNISRAAVEFGKYWRSDRILRRLEALLIVADATRSFLLSGNGDVLEPEDNVLAIGSGGQYAQAAALSLFRYTKLSARDIVVKSLDIAASICIYTNFNTVIKELRVK